MEVKRTTRVLGAAEIAAIVQARGLDRTLDELIERLRDALITFDRAITVSPVRAGFQYERPVAGLLEWMPTMELGRVIAVKTVGYHPSNPTQRALPSIMATTSLYDTSTGRLTALVDATLLTALRTGAASAVATDILAVTEPVTVGVVGCGTQAVTQLHAISRVRPITRVLAWDTDAAVAASFARRTAFLDRPVEVVERADDALLAAVDVLCTCTSVEVGKGPVIRDGAHRPWLHINAVGADFPGKRELPQSLLERALLCPDLVAQCRGEGESQWVDGEQLGPDLVTLVQQRSCWESARSRLTVFDSTGWALEDLVAAELFVELACSLQIGRHLDLQSTAIDPYDPYCGLVS